MEKVAYHFRQLEKEPQMIVLEYFDGKGWLEKFENMAKDAGYDDLVEAAQEYKEEHQ